MKMMARKKLLAKILAIALVILFAVPLTTFAGEAQTQVHVKKVAGDISISAITLVYDTGAPLYQYLELTDAKGNNWTSADYKEDVVEGLLKMVATFTGDFGEFTQTYKFSDDFGERGGKETEPVEYSAQGAGGAGSINIWINKVDYPKPELSIDKKVRLSGSAIGYTNSLTVTQAESAVEYLFKVTNKGNVALNAFVHDQTLDWTSSTINIPAGGSHDFTHAYNISIGDWDDNEFVNIATAGAIYNSIYNISSDTDDAKVIFNETFKADPKLEIEKRVRLAGSTEEDDFVRELEVGSKVVDVEYQFKVINTGNVALEDVQVYDPLLGWTSGLIDLDVGEDYPFTYGPYNISGDAWNESLFINFATAAGIYNGEPVETDSAAASVEYKEQTNPEDPDIDFVKEVSPSTVSSRTATVTYTFTVTNDGAFDLYNVVITDSAIGYYYEVGDLAKGETTTAAIDFDLSLLGTDGYGTWDGDIFKNVAVVSGWYGPDISDDYFEVNIREVYEPQIVTDEDDATVTYSTSPGPGPRTRTTTSTTIVEEPIPAGPVVQEAPILEEPIPAGPLPKTGGIPSVLLYGLGALLAGGGTAIKLRNRNK